jgi:hypothetical protein
MCRIPELWTHQETAGYLRIEPDLLHHLVTLDRGPRCYWVGRHRRYESTGVRAWLLAQQRQPGRGHPPRHAATAASTAPAACGGGL